MKFIDKTILGVSVVLSVGLLNAPLSGAEKAAATCGELVET